MPKYDASNAEVLIYSFKDGLLAKLAHDLKMRVSDFSIEVGDDRSVKANFVSESLEVVSAMKDGREDSGTLSGGDKKKIYGNITKDVLKTRRHSTVTFEAKGDDVTVDEDKGTANISGALTLHGKTKTVRASVRSEGSDWVTSITLHQPDFGIKPFKAMAGALKIKPDVRVDVKVPKG